MSPERTKRLGAIVTAAFTGIVFLILPWMVDEKAINIGMAVLLGVISFIIVLIVQEVASYIYKIYSQKRDVKKAFCGLWINRQVQNPNNYGVYRIYYSNLGIAVRGRVFSVDIGDYTSSWRSQYVLPSPSKDLLTYMYRGESASGGDEGELSDEKKFGICRLSFSEIHTEHEKGDGYFIDDKRTKSFSQESAINTKAVPTASNIRIVVETKFEKVTDDLLKQLGIQSHVSSYLKYEDDFILKDTKTLIEAYHTYLLKN